MPPTNLLSELIATHRGGDLDVQATTEMQKAIDAVSSIKDGTPKATLTMTFVFSRDGDSKIAVTPKVKVTIPVPAVGGESHFVDKSGRLTDENPKQLNLANVPRRPAKLVDLDAERKDREPQSAPGTTATDPTKKGT